MDETASDHICRASQALQRTIHKCRKMPGWDAAAERELTGMGNRLLEIAAGVEERAGEAR
ncbi:MAG TPA: hypothetical protein VM223_06195 [Planctomycetota bacterium]|nr:hypothetical protein [Planctomycetota bacterium]